MGSNWKEFRLLPKDIERGRDMEALMKYFPLSKGVKADNVNELVKAIVIYVVAAVVFGFVLGLLAKIPLVGFIFSLIGTLIGIYALAGIIISVLIFVKVIK